MAMTVATIRAEAATIAAATCSIADVTTAYTASSNGDTVTVPAGSCTWSTGLGYITKQITLQGAGSSNTFIAWTGAGAPLGFQLTSDGPARITGFNFTRSGWASNAYWIVIQGKNSSAAGTAMTQLRIDHNKFTNGGRQIDVLGWAYGVIDHNTFVNGNIAVGFAGDNNLAWNRTIAAGTANAMFIEDNTFTIDNNRPVNSDNEQIYHQEGARSVVRYNTFDGTANTQGNSLIFETHGNFGPYYSGVDSVDARGQPLMEFYNNTVTVHHTYRIMYFRGGSALIHDNTFTVSSGAVSPITLTEEEGWYCPTTGQLCPTRTVWPGEDQVMNMFIWNNTINGAALTTAHVVLKNAADSTFIQENREYFLHAPQSSGGSESYTGRQGASSAAPTNSGSDTMIYTASGANAYYPYTIYTYPHPLAGTPVPDAPTGLRLLRAVSNASAMLTWTLNAETDIAGYYLYRTTTSGVYGEPLTPLITAASQAAAHSPLARYIARLPVAGTYYLALTAVNTAGGESAKSTPVTIEVLGITARAARQ